MKLLLFFVIISVSHSEVTGSNICPRNESYLAEVLISELKPYTVRNTTKYKLTLKTKKVTKWRLILDCCEGFKLNFNNNDCEPYCIKNCHSGWVGKFFNSPDQELNVNKNMCLCLNGGTCTSDGKLCRCIPGWFGTKCEQKCYSGYWGANCTEKCSCFNGTNCNPNTGKCICSPGFTGYECSNICSHGTYGKNCAFNCTCNNNGICSNVDGTCACFEGWSGNNCNVPHLLCDDEYEGNNCNVSVNNNKWLLYGCISLGVVICAILINSIVRFKTRTYFVKQDTSNNRLFRSIEESDFILPKTKKCSS